jgi:single-stranded-DNA-specific exonuclease
LRKQIQRRPLLGDPSMLPSHLPALVRRVYAARAVQPHELDFSLAQLLPGESMGGLERAVDLLEAALLAKKKILVIGDFDADGATSSALAIRALRAFGHEQVDFLVPNRFEYGYGLTPEIVELARARQPDLLVTVDNGISSMRGVDAARSAGMQVVITDHHLPGARLPAADAIVNPNMPGDDFPSKHLAGVGVIFYVMLALRARLRENGWFSSRGLQEPNMAELLDLVALGTVADVVTLDFNNRILIDQGIRRIRAGRCCPGILALLRNAGRDPSRLVASDLGFAVGPRLNAAGRLEDMSLGIACLLTDDFDEAAMMAEQLNELNQQRRAIEGVMQEEAMAVLERLEQDAAGLPPGLCLMDANWHQGVIGILASRIKDRFRRPAIAFAPAGEGELKGSARSVSGLHIRDLLDRIATQNPDLIRKFGGHAMAAGLSLAVDDFAEFQAAFSSAVADELGHEVGAGQLLTDGELEAADYDLSVAEALRDAGPWGQGFPEPQFDGVFDIAQSRIVGGRHVKLTVCRAGGDQWLDAIAFNGVDHGWHELRQSVRAVYRLDVNEFRGRRSVQLIVEYLEQA